ncbi:MAG: PilZ domain-containing protein [Candidatus Aceula meridiana]|nr:PilZ domain-containing protein [Candidatus Aceula meridiana]
MSQHVAEDQRIFERLSAELPSRIRKENSDQERSVLVKNLSAEGANILSTEEVFLNDQLSLLFEYPNSVQPLEVKGEVVWVGKEDPLFWKVGIQFNKINLMQTSRILTTPA